MRPQRTAEFSAFGAFAFDDRVEVYTNVRGGPQKAGTDPREINYDLAAQARRVLANSRQAKTRTFGKTEQPRGWAVSERAMVAVSACFGSIELLTTGELGRDTCHLVDIIFC